MSDVMNYPQAIMFILKNMYFAECTFEPELDEEGVQKKDAQGRGIQQAKHEEGLTFRQWCEKHDLIQSATKIIDPASKPLKIVKPNFKTK